MNRQDISELLEKVPDEFYEWVKKTKSELEKQYKDIFDDAKIAYDLIEKLPTRKDQAIKIMRSFRDISSILFAMLDNKDYRKVIWKKLKPEFSKPYHEIKEDF